MNEDLFPSETCGFPCHLVLQCTFTKLFAFLCWDEESAICKTQQDHFQVMIGWLVFRVRWGAVFFEHVSSVEKQKKNMGWNIYLTSKILKCFSIFKYTAQYNYHIILLQMMLLNIKNEHNVFFWAFSYTFGEKKPIPNLQSSAGGFWSWSGGGVDGAAEGWVMLTRSLSSLHRVEIFEMR